MTPVSFQLSAKDTADVLGATLKLASTDITLRRINCVLLRRVGDYLTATATNRYVLGVARRRLPEETVNPPDDWRFCVRLDQAKNLLKLVKDTARQYEAQLMIDVTGTQMTVRSYTNAWIGDNAEVPDERYPDTDRLLVRFLSTSAQVPATGGINIRQMMLLADAQKIFDGRCTSIRDVSEDPGQPVWALKIGCDFVGVLMGMRTPEASAQLDVTDWSSILP